MDLSRFFVDRPIFAAVVSILIFVAGVLAIPILPITEYPNVVPPTVQVRAVYPGADPRTISETVAAPLEEAINGVENMIYMKSVAGSDGVMVLNVTFRIGTDIDIAQVQVQNRVSQALQRLPGDVRNLGVTTTKQSPTLTMVVHLVSPKGTYDVTYLRNYAVIRIKDEIARLPGVGQTAIFGSGDYAMRIWLDPSRAAELGVSASDIVQALRQQNLQVSAGSIGGPPQTEVADFQLSINAPGRLVTEEQFGEVVLKVGARGEVVRLRDLATVSLGVNEYALRSLLDNKAAVAIPIFESPGANSIALSDTVRAKMTELARAFPDDVTWEVAYDPTVFVRSSIRSVISTLLEAVGLVVIVVILFLQTWRASIIPLVAVPVSIVGTFACLWLLGYSINVLTLFGMVLAIGIVVDDAIVVVENVERNIENGLTPLAAAHQAMSEVSGPIVAIALVLAAVFVPISFLGGITGEFYRQFAVTITISMFISAINSLTLSPALSALLLRPHDAPKDALTRFMDRVFGGIFRPFNRAFGWAAARYGHQVAGSLRRPARMLLAYAGLLLLAVVAFRAVPGGFIPTQDKAYLFGVVKLPEGASLDRTEAMVRKVSQIALETDGVRNAVAFPGLNALQFTNTPNTATIFFGLDDFSERSRSAEEIAGELSMRFSGELREGLAFAFMPPPILGLGNAAGYEMYLQDRSSAGYGALNQQIQALSGRLMSTPGFGFPATSYQSNVPQLSAQVDRTQAQKQGVLIPDLYETMQLYLGSQYINDFNLFGRTFQVYAQAAPEYRNQASDLRWLHARNRDGTMVPLAGMVQLKPSFGPDPVIRYNGYPAADLQGAADPAVVSSSEAISTVGQFAREMLPNGMSFEWTGLTYQQVSQGNAGLLVFPLCVLLVLMVLAALYESWSLPFSVILIVPMCLLFALGGVWITGGDNNVFVQIGLVVLMGLACKNAILIVEFARELEGQGRTPVQAAIEASRLRLRPIVMTSFAFIAGVVPLVLASGAGAEVRNVMGVTVLAGMLGVTLFGLYLTPVFYSAIRRRTLRGAAMDEPSPAPPSTPPQGHYP